MEFGIRWALAASGILFCGAMWFRQACRPASDQPLLDLPVRQWTLEDMSYSALALPVRNAGTRRLVLNELNLACGCGDRVMRTVIVSPGETVIVHIPYDSRVAPGTFPEVAGFTTNDPAHARFGLFAGKSVVAAKQTQTNPDQKGLISVQFRQ